MLDISFVRSVAHALMTFSLSYLSPSQKLAIALFIAALLATALAYDLPGGDLGSEIFWQLRLPRVLLAFMAGAGLAVSGLWLQTLFRHALVEPGLLGVSAGASLAAVLSLLLGTAYVFFMPIAACIGAALALTTVLAMARRYQLQAEALLLVGIALNAVLSAATQLLLIMSPDNGLRAGSFWLMGSFANAEWSWLAANAVLLVGLLIWGMRQRASFDIWLLGEHEAGHLGLNVRCFRRQVIWASAAVVAMAVAQTGSIAFIGLMAPHIASRLVGHMHRQLMPASLLIGGILAIFADTLARTLMAPLELPVGILTALFGAPFFLFILRQRWQR
jgi:iron complex transport system permease protein